jgi:DNA-binding Xre family transcriptional regulator
MPKKKPISTFDRVMKDPKRKGRFEDAYAQFLLSEIILGLMEQEKISVRALARKAGISPAVIQDIRSGSRSNITVKNLLGIVSSLGARVMIEKGSDSYLLVD